MVGEDQCLEMGKKSEGRFPRFGGNQKWERREQGEGDGSALSVMEEGKNKSMPATPQTSGIQGI